MIYGKAPLLMALKDGVKGRRQMPVKSSMVQWFCLLQLPTDGFKLWIINSLMQSWGVCLTCPDCNSKKYISQGLLLLHLNATPRKMSPVPIYTLYNRTPDPSCLKMPNIAIHLVSHYSADKYIPVHLSGKPIKYYCTILYVATVWIKIQWIALSTFWINKRNIITL